MDLAKLNEALTYYIRPTCFPLAIKLLPSEDQAPPKARRPKRDLGIQIPVCQAVGMARRYGWTMLMTREDHQCPYGALTLGTEEAATAYLDGSLYESINPGSGAVAAKNAKLMPRLEAGKYAAVAIAPIQNASFEPDIILIYGNSAQIMRLVQGRIYKEGGALTASASGGQDCAEIFSRTLIGDECQFILPCNGDRVFGMTQDDEMAFSMPVSKVETTIAGLEASHKSGAQRYPIPVFMRFNAQMPPAYQKLLAHLQEE